MNLILTPYRGANSKGQLGDGTATSRNVPVAVDMTGVLSGKTVTDIACGELHSLALTSDGKLFSW
jgi:alpha-tubulin suppressor-like RCC1 family protein